MSRALSCGVTDLTLDGIDRPSHVVGQIAHRGARSLAARFDYAGGTGVSSSADFFSNSARVSLTVLPSASPELRQHLGAAQDDHGDEHDDQDDEDVGTLTS